MGNLADNKRPVYVAVDFDGTCVEHRFPDIGPDVPGAVEWLRRFQQAGALLILWTMRANGGPDGDVLDDAIEWFADRGIQLHAVNRNPGQVSWSSSPKAYAHAYIDDANAGRPMVDWSRIGPAVLAQIRNWPVALAKAPEGQRFDGKGGIVLDVLGVPPIMPLGSA